MVVHHHYSELQSMRSDGLRDVVERLYLRSAGAEPRSACKASLGAADRCCISGISVTSDGTSARDPSRKDTDLFRHSACARLIFDDDRGCMRYRVSVRKRRAEKIRQA